MKLSVIDLMADLQILYGLAKDVVRYEAEQLAAADSGDLQLLLSCDDFRAKRIIAYARVKTGGSTKVAPAPAVSIASLQTLYDTAIETWLRKGMITAGPLKVALGEGVNLWVKAERRYFLIAAHDFGQNHALGYKVWGSSSLVNMLCTMGGRAWLLPIDGVLRTLISFAESYND